MYVNIKQTLCVTLPVWSTVLYIYDTSSLSYIHDTFMVHLPNHGKLWCFNVLFVNIV